MIILFLVLSLVPLIVFYFYVDNITRSYYINTRIAEVSQQAFIISTRVSQHGFENLSNSSIFRQFDEEVLHRSNEWQSRILIFDYQSVVIVDSNRHQANRIGQILFIPEVWKALNNEISTNVREDENALYVAIPANDSSGLRGATLVVVSVEDIFSSLDEIRNTFLLILVIISLVVFIAGFITSNVFIKPLKQIIYVVDKMTAGKLDYRIDLEGQDEYAYLANSFNTMTDKIKEVNKAREEFVSNVSHELKTPLTAIKSLCEPLLINKTNTEELYREFLSSINDEVDRMKELNEDLLALVSIDKYGQKLNFSEVSLNVIIESIVKTVNPIAKRRSIALLFEGAKYIQVVADEMKLGIAILNVVSNGVKYTPDGGTVKIRINSDDQMAYIYVEDTGMGIDKSEHTKIFDRFYRVDKTRDRETGGTGLGLAIAHSTMLAHNGSVTVLESKIDKGTTFLIKLPLKR